MSRSDHTDIPEVDKRRAAIQRMFASIAPRYDLLNHALSLSIDRRWRRAAVAALAPRPGERILDACTGTADLALLLSDSGARVAGTDFTLEMLLGARRKLRTAPGVTLVAADTLRLPFTDGFFDGVTVGFGIRNFENLAAGLTEIGRVLRPGGRVALLEFSTPVAAPLRAAYHAYLRHVIPAVGRLLSRRDSPYRYLSASVLSFPDQAGLTALLQQSGFRDVRYVNLTGGIAAIHLASRP